MIARAMAEAEATLQAAYVPADRDDGRMDFGVRDLVERLSALLKRTMR